MFYYLNELTIIWMFNVDNYTGWTSSAKWFCEFPPEGWGSKWTQSADVMPFWTPFFFFLNVASSATLHLFQRSHSHTERYCGVWFCRRELIVLTWKCQRAEGHP